MELIAVGFGVEHACVEEAQRAIVVHRLLVEHDFARGDGQALTLLGSQEHVSHSHLLIENSRLHNISILPPILL